MGRARRSSIIVDTVGLVGRESSSVSCRGQLSMLNRLIRYPPREEVETWGWQGHARARVIPLRRGDLVNQHKHFVQTILGSIMYKSAARRELTIHAIVHEPEWLALDSFPGE